MLQKNSQHTVDITGYTSQGYGVGKVEVDNGQYPLFIKGAIKGEKILAKIVKPTKTYAWAIISEILEKSPQRIEPDCPYYKQCGGCSSRHMSYSEEVEFKKQKVQDCINKIAAGSINKITAGSINKIAGRNTGVACGTTEVDATLCDATDTTHNTPNPITLDKFWAAQQTDRYRNKAELPVRRRQDNSTVIGMFQNRSHNVVEIDDCKLQNKSVAIVCKQLEGWMRQFKIPGYNEKRHTGIIRGICVRTNSENDVMVCIIATKNKIANIDKLIDKLRSDLPQLKSLILNVNDKKTNVIFGKKFKTIWGKDEITQQICGLNFKISAASFFQVNKTQAELLYKRAIELADIKNSETVVDMYCGTGTITLLLAQHAKQAIGIEIVKEAVKNAKQNASENKIKNVEFICSDSQSAAAKIAECDWQINCSQSNTNTQNNTKNNDNHNKNAQIDVVSVDPPRKGLDTGTINAIAKMNPKRIVYISCNPSTLARDIAKISEVTNNGYILKNLEAVDMFPRTSHVETIALLARK